MQIDAARFDMVRRAFEDLDAICSDSAISLSEIVIDLDRDLELTSVEKARRRSLDDLARLRRDNRQVRRENWLR